MHHESLENLIIVQNSQSTHFEAVKKLFQLLDAYELVYEVYHTPSANTEENIRAMQQDLPDGAMIISAAGDGTAMQLINAVLRGQKDETTLGFAPLGNFNDIARSHIKRGHTVIDMLIAPVVESHPITIEADGEYWRHAPAYVTLGWTALAANGFSEADSRESLRHGRHSAARANSLRQLSKHYFGNRDLKLPPFRLNGDEEVFTEVTDILAINNPRVGAIVRSNEPYFNSPNFGSRANINVSRILPNISFGLKALLGRAPLEPTEELHISFEDTVSLPIQTEGEFQQIEAKEIHIYKNPHDTVRILHSK
jgi:hypothetical protein